MKHQPDHMQMDKTAHLAECLDLDRPELAAIKSSPVPAEAYVRHLAASRCPHFKFEYDRKQDMLEFLADHYPAWRNYDTTVADGVCAMDIAQAQGLRALKDITALARAWWATGDPSYASAFERFYLAVPTGEMFNWAQFNGHQGALETEAFFLLQDCELFTTQGRIAFLDHLYAITVNAWDTHTSNWQQIELGPEGHNWYLHGMWVLPMLGLMFPEFKRSEFFVRTGLSVVEEHLRGHFKPDGGARETSLGYQAGSLKILWDICLLAIRNGVAFSEGFVDKLLGATLFLMRLATPQGTVPSFTDVKPSPGDLTQLAATAAAVTGDGRCKWYAEKFRVQLAAAAGETPGQIPQCAFWAVGLASAEKYAEMVMEDPNHVSVLMGDTGYAVMRDGDSAETQYLAIASADRGRIITSHGHNDIFAIEVHAGRTRFLGDLGCADYAEPDMTEARAYDLKTESHNCLTVNNEEQVEIIDQWRWNQCVTPAIRRWISTDTHDYFHAVHEGYYHFPHAQTLHARKVLFVKSAPSYWILMDWVESNTTNDYAAWFHGCVPGKIDGANLLLGDLRSGRLAILPPAGEDIVLERVSNQELIGYIEQKQISPEQYPCFAYRKRSASDCLVWAIIPLGRSDDIPQVRRMTVSINGQQGDPHAATGLQVTFDGHTDKICCSHKDFDAQLICGDDSVWGNLFFKRLANDGKTLLSFTHVMSDGVCGH